jgi:hypothetical protein
MWQEDIQVTLPGEVETTLTGHLVDCRAYQGMSGSPCFLQRAYPLLAPELTMRYNTLFIGMIAAHLDDVQNAITTGDLGADGTIRYNVHTGVGIVTPARFILETLHLDELVASRSESDRVEGERRRQQESIGPSEEPDDGG